MKTEKREKRRFKNLPYDCWSRIITFYEGKEEFLSLNLSVKGLYIPQCTKNIEFNLKKLSALPTKPRKYVTSLSIGDRENAFENLDTFLNTLQEDSKKPKDLEDLFLALRNVFPNVLNLNLNFRRKYSTKAEQKAPMKPMIAIPSVSVTVPFLKVLRITISQTALNMFEESIRNGYFHNLEELALISIRSEYEWKDPRAPWELYNISRERLYKRSLSINFQNLKKIRKLELCGWNFELSSTNLLQMKNLRTLFLENAIVNDNGGISNIEELYFIDIGFVSGAYDFPNFFKNIKKITIIHSSKYLYNNIDYENDEFSTSYFTLILGFELKNFQYLEEIIILKEEFRLFQFGFYEEDNDSLQERKIKFQDLPRLRKIKIKTFCSIFTEVAFRNTPSLEYFDFFNTPGDVKTFVSLPDISSMKKIFLNNIHLDSQSIKNIQNYKKLQELKIIANSQEKVVDVRPKIILENMQELRTVEICQKIHLVEVRNCKELKKIRPFFS